MIIIINNNNNNNNNNNDDNLHNIIREVNSLPVRPATGSIEFPAAMSSLVISTAAIAMALSQFGILSVHEAPDTESFRLPGRRAALAAWPAGRWAAWPPASPDLSPALSLAPSLTPRWPGRALPAACVAAPAAKRPRGAVVPASCFVAGVCDRRLPPDISNRKQRRAASPSLAESAHFA